VLGFLIGKAFRISNIALVYVLGSAYGCDSDNADVAELADAHDSGSCASNGVEVQVLSSAPISREHILREVGLIYLNR
jgi:hypothetical protein